MSVDKTIVQLMWTKSSDGAWKDKFLMLDDKGTISIFDAELKHINTASTGLYRAGKYSRGSL